MDAVFLCKCQMHVSALERGSRLQCDRDSQQHKIHLMASLSAVFGLNTFSLQTVMPQYF